MYQTNSNRWVFSSESVTEGHPDKICDQISDAVLDEIIKQDPKARVACETICTTGMVLLMGEITTTAYVDIPGIARETVKEIGYDGRESGFDYKSCAVLSNIDEQSGDISMGVDKSWESRAGESSDLFNTGAGDQGIMFGYANNDTPEYMPLPISLAHALTQKLSEVRKSGAADFLRPDGKSQVSVEYEGNKPLRITNVVISTQHSPDISQEELEKKVHELVIEPILPAEYLDAETKYYINPTGRFVIGGPQGDSGLTGRKIIVDTYGGFAPHGGGAFSGKDPTKVDRSASYAARYVAKNIVASGLAEACQVQLAYAIGVAKPLSIYVTGYGTGKVSDDILMKIVNKVFDLRPAAIIRDLDLLRPIYKKTAAYGHFGRNDPDFTWEKLDKIEAILDAAKSV